LAADAAVERARAWLDKHDTAESDGWDSCAQMLADFAAEENKALREALKECIDGATGVTLDGHHQWCKLCGADLKYVQHVEGCGIRLAKVALADELEAETKREG
jgi:hypothetical protein